MDVRSVLCPGTNLDGTPCSRHRRRGEETCIHHSPERVEERARALEEQAARLRDNAKVSG